MQCDMVHVRDAVHFENECPEKFMTNSVVGMARVQAKLAGWARVRCGRVAWPGTPPMEDGKKVDLCPKHSTCIKVKVPKVPKVKLELVK